MQASKQRKVALNARIREPLSIAFDIAVARRQVSKQTAVEQAIRLWIKEQKGRGRRMTDAPLVAVHEKRKGTLKLTNEQIDEILLG